MDDGTEWDLRCGCAVSLVDRRRTERTSERHEAKQSAADEVPERAVVQAQNPNMPYASFAVSIIALRFSVGVRGGTAQPAIRT